MVTVAVTGVGGLIGRRLVEALERDRRVERILGVDVREPEGISAAKHQWRRADITDADEVTAALQGADVVVHLAFQMDPLHDEAKMHAVNIRGTRNVAQAAVAVGARKLVYTSSGVVYGAHPDNEVPLTEDAPLRACGPFSYAEHKQEVEEWLWPWAESHPELTVTVLRPSIVAGPGMQNFMSRQLEQPRFLAVKGHRPPMQFAHVEDVASALAHAVRTDIPGAYNVTSEGWLSFDEITAILDRKVLEVPEELAFGALERLWELGIGEAPPGELHYLMHPWVLSVERLEATGWAPQHSNRDALAATVEEHADWLSLGGWRIRRSTLQGGLARVGAVVAVLLVLARLVRRMQADGEPPQD